MCVPAPRRRGDRMRRREFIALLGGGAVGWPLLGLAQQPTMRVIGFLNTSRPYPLVLNEFHSGLAEIGYHEGQNVLIEYRWAEGHYDRLPSLAAAILSSSALLPVTAVPAGTSPGLPSWS